MSDATACPLPDSLCPPHHLTICKNGITDAHITRAEHLACINTFKLTADSGPTAFLFESFGYLLTVPDRTFTAAVKTGNDPCADKRSAGRLKISHTDRKSGSGLS